MTAAAGKKPAFKLPILEGVLPIDMSRLPVDLIAGATLAALAIPETMGYSEDRRHAGHHRPVHHPAAHPRLSLSWARPAIW